MVQFRRFYLLIGCFFLGLIPWSIHSAQAETMFEGYYKIVSGTTKIGYFIQRYEFDPKTKKFISTYFIQTNDLGGNTTESLRAFADDKFQPVSYQYTVKTPQMVKTIDATFKGTIMNAVITTGANAQTVSKKVPKGTFLSTFLGYLILQKGYTPGKKFNYSAVAEEDAESYNGEAYVKEQQTFLNKPVFKVLNSFKGVKFVSFVTEKGEVLGTQSPLQQIATELSPSASSATEGFTLPSGPLKILFGKVPLGKPNILAGSEKAEKAPAEKAPEPAPEPEPEKKESAPKKLPEKKTK
ncbi:MAG: hypothetical protein H6624_20110 [Bdellovibrionaceae bacterium]|nr:hypothetical protein [Bdellovibrionales bacterium]MCB0383956.1 hypothetical protein [Bdellovibrionales bacterium]MCB9086657.1 hypothetical protein [Pseudobdellovibrionaceae bacterium]